MNPHFQQWDAFLLLWNNYLLNMNGQWKLKYKAEQKFYKDLNCKKTYLFIKGKVHKDLSEYMLL